MVINGDCVTGDYLADIWNPLKHFSLEALRRGQQGKL